MKALSVIAAATLLSAGIASSASAMQRSYEPANTPFTATGSITVTSPSGSLPCQTVLTGTTVGGGSITGATFSGSSCGSLKALALPWTMSSFGNSGTGINFANVGFSAPAIGVCHPARVKGTLGIGGKLTFSGAGVGVCSMSGTLVTSPAIRIAPK
jgi:hypothetical protein